MDPTLSSMLFGQAGNVGLGAGLQGSSLPLSPSQLQMTSLAGMNGSHLVHQQQQQQQQHQLNQLRLQQQEQLQQQQLQQQQLLAQQQQQHRLHQEQQQLAHQRQQQQQRLQQQQQQQQHHHHVNARQRGPAFAAAPAAGSLPYHGIPTNPAANPMTLSALLNGAVPSPALVDDTPKLTAWQLHRQQADSQKETQRLEALRKRHAAAAKSLRTEEAHHATLSNTLRLVERQVAAGRAEIEGIRAKVAEIAAVPTEAPSAEVVRLEAENDALAAKLEEQTGLFQRLQAVCRAREEKRRRLEATLIHQSLVVHPQAERLHVTELRNRFSDCHVPEDAKEVVSYIHDEGATVPCPEPELRSGPDVVLLTDQQAGEATRLDGVKYTVKIVLLTPREGSNNNHPHDRLQLVGARVLESDEFTCYGGPWHHSQDGGDPSALETLSAVVKRHIQSQSGFDLGFTHLLRFCTFKYEKEIVEYLTPDPGTMGKLVLRPLARLDSRQLLRTGDLRPSALVAPPPVITGPPKGKGGGKAGKPGKKGRKAAAAAPPPPPPPPPAGAAPGSDALHGEEEVAAKVLSVPHAKPLREAVAAVATEGSPSYAWEMAVLSRLLDDRLRRTATQRILTQLESEVAGTKRPRDQQSAELPPLHEDPRVPTPASEGYRLSTVKRVRKTTITNDPIKVRGYQFFDLPDMHGDRNETISKTEVLSAMVALGTRHTMKEITSLLPYAGFTTEKPYSCYLEKCCELKTDVSYDFGPEVPVTVSL